MSYDNGLSGQTCEHWKLNTERGKLMNKTTKKLFRQCGEDVQDIILDMVELDITDKENFDDVMTNLCKLRDILMFIGGESCLLKSDI